MFGLMQFTSCHKTEEELLRRRLLYCGSCKAIASEYGQSARMLLNNDVVFLAEILHSLSSQTGKLNLDEWALAIQSFNCFSIPSKEEIPSPLRIAASVCLFLADLKLEDHILDTQSPFPRTAKRCLTPAFEKALRDLDRMKFPVEEIRHWFDQQTAREESTGSTKGGAARLNSQIDRLNYLAEPTARMTGLVFEHASCIVDGEQHRMVMNRLGSGFGRLIYVIDAIEDLEKDFKTGAFNALRRSYEFDGADVPHLVPESVDELVVETIVEIGRCLEQLPIEANQRREYGERLRRNVLRKTNLEIQTHRLHFQKIFVQLEESRETESSTRKTCSVSAKGSLEDARRAAFSKASQLTEELNDCRTYAIPLISAVHQAFIFNFVFMIALLSPLQTRSITSYRKCAQLPMNLMFWGAAINTIANAIGRATRSHRPYALAMATAGGGGHDDTELGGKFGGTRNDDFNNQPDAKYGADEEEPAHRDHETPKRGNPFKSRRRSPRLTGSENSTSEQPEESEGEQHSRKKGVQNMRKRAAERTTKPVACCCCMECTEGCCDCCEGIECLSECCGGEGLCGGTAGTDAVCCCDGAHGCCDGGCQCCAGGGECCAGGSECCAGGDCCAGGGDCCAGGADCCGGCST